jgi:hypothetical protein
MWKTTRRKTTMFDEQHDGDPHGECAAEIHSLEAENAALREWIAECRDTVLYPVAHADTDVGKRAELLGAATVALLRPNA